MLQNTIKLYTLVLLTCIGYVGTSQEMVLSIAHPKVKAVDNVYDLNDRIEIIIKKAVAERSGSVKLVDRSNIGIIEQCRKRFPELNNPNIPSMAMVGATHIIETKVSQFSIRNDSTSIQKNGAKEGEYIYKPMRTIHIDYFLDLQLVEIETGSLINELQLKVEGFDYDFDNKVSEEEVILSANDELDKSLYNLLVEDLPVFLGNRMRVLDMVDSKKEKARKILINTGVGRLYQTYYDYNIYHNYVDDIAGNKVERYELVGKGRFDDDFLYYETFNVKDGNKKVYELMQEGASLYVGAEPDQKLYTEVSRHVNPESRNIKITQYKLDAESDKPTPKVELTKEETKEEKANKKRIQNKTVKRKKD